jgi:heme oxygenase
MQRVVDEMERQLGPLLEEQFPDFAARKKAAMLQTDLEYLRTGENNYPLFRFSIPDGELAYAWGAFYVLEGSSLGGRVILKSLPSSLGVTEQQGASYFAGYGKGTGPMWQQFLKQLEAFAAKTQDPSVIIRAAENTFIHILQHFDRCAAYEAERHRK